MKSVRQVSIVLRDVAETVRVTDRPKKLKPLLEYELSHEVILAGLREVEGTGVHPEMRGKKGTE